MEAKRIALVVASMRAGGAERVALNLAGEFIRRGLEVDLVLVDATGPLLDQLPAKIRVIDLGRGRASRAIGALRRYLRKEKPSAIIAFTFHINILACIANIGMRHSRLILTVHSGFSEALNAAAPSTRFLMMLATSTLYRNADCVVAVSNGVADDLARVARLPRCRVVTIHNPVIGDGFDAAAASPPDHPWAFDKSRPLVVSAGRLAPQKDFPTLIRGFSRVAGETGARLLILGEGEVREQIESLARQLELEDSISLPGFTENPLPIMKAADLFVLSSTVEGFGNVLVEAMATGTSVVSTDCPHGPREILENGKWGKLVPPADSAALGEAILEVLRTGGVDARSRAQQFSVEIAADRYLSAAFV